VFKLPKIRIAKYEYAAVFGSRKVIKDPGNPNQNHYYKTDGDDLWTGYGKQIAELIPEGTIVYGELIGFTPDGGEIQKNYVYDAAPNTAELYVYRVATINRHGVLSDLSWDGVKAFCGASGLKWTPELARIPVDMVDEWLEAARDAVFWDDWCMGDTDTFAEEPLQLSKANTVDEGVVVRQDALVPVLLKAKSPEFLAHETRMLDKGEADIESMEGVAA
jgi:hypothetical protein